MADNELVEAARFADVGVVPYAGRNPNHLYCCPNKLSEYMQAGLAVFSNRLEFVESVIEQYDCGATYDSATPSAVAAAVRSLASDREVLLRKRVNAYEAAQESFNWEIQSRPYKEAIVSLLALSA